MRHQETTVERYNAAETPDLAEWLELDEDERTDLVTEYHQRIGEQLPTREQNTLHALMHVIVENQLALEVFPVVEALSRLMSQGLGRHEALHAIASVLAGQIYDSLGTGTHDINELYAEKLHHLTADSWRDSTK